VVYPRKPYKVSVYPADCIDEPQSPFEEFGTIDQARQYIEDLKSKTELAEKQKQAFGFGVS
jgi:hypothetical protein